jgi:hypothetical protein
MYRHRPRPEQKRSVLEAAAQPSVAVCCCNDSRSSLSSRVFSIAMTACWRRHWGGSHGSDVLPSRIRTARPKARAAPGDGVSALESVTSSGFTKKPTLAVPGTASFSSSSLLPINASSPSLQNPVTLPPSSRGSADERKAGLHEEHGAKLRIDHDIAHTVPKAANVQAN